MCRLFAVIGKEIPIKSLLTKFRQLAENGKVPPTKDPGHHDGWGIGYFAENEVLLEKNYLSASVDPKYEEVIRNLPKKFTGVLMGHLRKASKGNITAENSHPFLTDNQLFMHNGTVQFPGLVGSDSLRYLDELVALRTENSHPNFTGFKNMLSTAGIQYSSITSAFAEPQKLWIFRCASRTPEYYTMLFQTHPDYIIFCQEPLNTGEWEDVEINEIVSIQSSTLHIQRKSIA